MQPVKLKDGNLNLDESYISLVNKETQTDATDSFLENYYVRFHRSQNPSAIQSENSIKLLAYCHKKGEGGTVTIKDNTIIIKEPLRRNTPSLVENISQNTGPSGKSAYCEEVLIPYLKSPPPDCELHEHLTLDFPEETPDQPDINTNKTDMKNNRTNSDNVCNGQGAEPPMDRPETTELTDLARGLKYVASAIFSPLCKNCEAKVDDKITDENDNDPCEKSSSTQMLIDAMSNVSQGIKNVHSKMMSAICPCKNLKQSQTLIEKPPEKPPEIPPPELEVTKSESTSSVKGAYAACKQKTICIAKGVRSSISNLLCTPCPCPKPCELPVPCSLPNIAASPEDDQPPDCPPKEEEAPASPPEEESPLGTSKKEDEEPPCPVVKEKPPCPPPEEKLPCQPKDVELPPCKKKVIKKPPCPPEDDKPPCLPPRKEKKCPPKDKNCTPKDKCKIKDPVMAVKMPKCKGEKPTYYLTDRSKICKPCEEVSFDADSQHQVNTVTLENKGQLSNETVSNIKTEDVHFDATRKVLSLYSMESANITNLNNEMETRKEIKPDLQNQSCIDTELSAQSYRLPRISLDHKIKSNEKVSNSENDNIITTKVSTQSNDITRVISLNNDIKSRSDVSNNIVANEDQRLSLKDRLVKSLTNVKESMSHFIHTVHKINEPTSVLSDESQLIKVTETASTENKFPSIVNINRNSDLDEDQTQSDDEENEATTMERASIMMAPIVARLAGAVDTTMTTLKERLDFERFSIHDNVRKTTERSSPYDKLGMTSATTKELSNTDSEPVSDEPSSLPKSVFTTIKSKLFGMFSDRERTDNPSSSAAPVLQRTSKASVRFKNSNGSLD